MKKVIHLASSRGYFDYDWLKTCHTFSFSNYHNPKRMHFGALRVINDDVISPEEGFDRHPHENMEIITIPLKGYIRHGDSLDNSEVITRGQIQVMSAGKGIEHLEYNDSSTENLELLQVWVFPKEKDTTPKYINYIISDLLKKNDISLFLSPKSEASINQNAWFSWANLNKSLTKKYNLYSKGNGVYVFVLDGEIELDGEVFSKRDGIGITDANSFEIKALKDSELILFEVAMR